MKIYIFPVHVVSILLILTLYGPTGESTRRTDGLLVYILHLIEIISLYQMTFTFLYITRSVYITGSDTLPDY